MAEPSYITPKLTPNPTNSSLQPLYYTDAQMAQMLKPPPDQLSQIAGTPNLQQLFPQLYAAQANQQDQAGVPAPQTAPQGYRRGGQVQSSPVLNVVDNNAAVDALIRDKSILSRYGVDMTSVPPERKPATPQPTLGQGEERDDEGFVPGHAKGGLIEPTEAQKHAGNYKKLHGHVRGIPISIENEAGSIRSGKSKDGTEWSVRMPHHYGYFKRTEGKDGDQVDVHVGPHIETDKVHIIDQVHPETKKFDEHKVMMGFEHPHEAVHAYHNSFSDGKGHLRMGGMVTMHINDFKKWLGNKQATKKRAAPPHKAKGGILQHFAGGGIANVGLHVTPLTGAIMPPAQTTAPSPVALAAPTPTTAPTIAGDGSQIIDGSATDTGQGGYTVNPNTRDNLLASLFPKGVQKMATGGPVMPRIKQYASTLPGNNYVPPMPHYRDALGNTDMSATRNALQNMVR